VFGVVYEDFAALFSYINQLLYLSWIPFYEDNSVPTKQLSSPCNDLKSFFISKFKGKGNV